MYTCIYLTAVVAHCRPPRYLTATHVYMYLTAVVAHCRPPRYLTATHVYMYLTAVVAHCRPPRYLTASIDLQRKSELEEGIQVYMGLGLGNISYKLAGYFLYEEPTKS